VPSFFVESFGCRATQADGAAIERDLVARGMHRAAEPGNASIVVLNTCTVTAAADQDARSAIRRVHRQNPEAKILVTGCYAQRAPEELAAIPGVSFVVGNSHKHRIGEIACGAQSFVAVESLVQPSAVGPWPQPRLPIDERLRTANMVAADRLRPTAFPTTADRGPQTFVSDIFAHTELLAAPVFEGESGWERTRPNLKVQDGCDNRCSFCVIPYVRGQSRSLALDEVIREAEALVRAGYKELVLSGINLGRWGRDRSQRDGAGSASTRQRFADLVRALLDRTAIEKIRISSVEPMDWTDDLIELVATSRRIAKHAHVPLQSGSDRILRKMHRKYRPWHYADRIHKIRAAMPDAAIGADVMVGFPGESDVEFDESRRQLPCEIRLVATLRASATVSCVSLLPRRTGGFASHLSAAPSRQSPWRVTGTATRKRSATTTSKFTSRASMRRISG
jgi:threonylcarbamoyladenosine tRNA methylthiotransferase MtaB